MRNLFKDISFEVGYNHFMQWGCRNGEETRRRKGTPTERMGNCGHDRKWQQERNWKTGGGWTERGWILHLWNRSDIPTMTNMWEEIWTTINPSNRNSHESDSIDQEGPQTKAGGRTCTTCMIMMYLPLPSWLATSSACANPSLRNVFKRNP